MITDDERREMARKLRDLAAEDLDDGEFYDCGEVGDALGLFTDDGAWYEAGGVRHLADLIEPEPERTCHPVIEDETGVCSNCGEDIDGYGWSYCPNCGRRIVEQ